MKTNDSTLKLIFIAVFALSTMGLVPVLVNMVAANEITIGIARLSIGALGIAVIAYFKRQQLLQKENLKWLFLLGFVFAVHWYTYFKALKMATPSLGAIGISTFGIHLLFLNRFFFGQKLQLADFIAVAAAFGGVLLATPNLQIAPDHFYGFLWAIFSGFLYALLPIINRKANHLTTEQKAFGQFGFGLLFFIWFIPWGNWQLSQFDWFGLFILGALCTLVSHTLWVKVSSELPSTITATVYYIYVPVAILYSYLFIGEELTVGKLAGAGLIIAANVAVVLLHQRDSKKS